MLQLGVQGCLALPVTAIVEYTFTKLNHYFIKYSKETDKQIAGKNKDKYKFPPKVDTFMEFQSRKADSQSVTLFDDKEWIYQVNEPGGTTNDGVQHGGRAFKVSLKTCDCTCGRPLILHLPCSHLYRAARTRNVDLNHPLTVRESEFSIVTTKNTWAPRFNPYFDQTQWPEYHGVQLWPHPDWKVGTRGRWRTKCCTGDMDGWGHGGTREWDNDQFEETRGRARCGKCHGEGQNTRSCTQRKRTKRNEGRSHEGPSRQGPNPQGHSHGGPSQHGHRQRGQNLGLTRGRGGGGSGRGGGSGGVGVGRGLGGGGRPTAMRGYLRGPFPYVTHGLTRLFMFFSLLTTKYLFCVRRFGSSCEGE